MVKGETWNDWVERMREVMKEAAVSLGWLEVPNSFTTYRRCNKNGTTLREKLLEIELVSLWGAGDVVTTVHKVKGAEFDTVIYFLPKLNKDKCPSVQWWGTSSSEERRVAFVATSRARKHFVLCIHNATYEALKKAQPDFLSLFQQVVALPGVEAKAA